MKRHELDVYFIMGTINCSGDPLVILEKALQAGITMFQLREKGDGALTGTALVEFAKSCQKLCRQYNVPFIINDHVELALEIDADGIHIGQDDTELAQIRTPFPNKWIGVSVHSMEEMDFAVKDGADYVGIGPIFETTSKLDAKDAAGVTFLTLAREAYPSYPIVAIGGITTKDVYEVRAAGADGVAVISAICQSDDINATVKAIKDNPVGQFFN
ncbi:thiamine phosphate synthase [Solibacillus sp. R5-41]|uniref:thiamine phosphate synthase n=1 Tax=Solibacillus sp. R5-41 TaxID=2048654 RepID=UPI00267E51B9|nr:thiamine phosphate synthase [Solibacillus sp. R5-41]